MHIDELYRIYLQHPAVETDSRKIKPGDIFFALKGPNYNGNGYAKMAIAAGASLCIVDEAVPEMNDKMLLVDNSLVTLQALAKKHRQQFEIPVIGITGSNGKTTTKELIHAVLSAGFTTYTTTGNLNNHIGVPLTILKIKKDAAFAVIEMGANHVGEIAGYCEYAMPTHGLITNCGKAHLEGFGSAEAIKKAKGELYDWLRNHNGSAFVFWDYDYLREMSKGILNVVKYGTHESDVNYAGHIKSSNELLEVLISKGLTDPEIKSNLIGAYNLPNILAAVAVGKTFHVPDKLIRTALENYQPSNSRSQLIEKDGNKVILDAYNANPSSMKAAIENFAAMSGNNKVLILGGMMELGTDSDLEHGQLLQLIQENNWKDVVLVGEHFKNVPAGFLHFKNAGEAKDWYAKQHFKNAQVLIKGSRSMEMEKVLD